MAGGDIIKPQMKQAVFEEELHAIIDSLEKGMKFLAVAIRLKLNKTSNRPSIFTFSDARLNLVQAFYPPPNAGESVDYAMQIVEYFVRAFIDGGELFCFVLLTTLIGLNCLTMQFPFHFLHTRHSTFKKQLLTLKLILFS